MKKFAQEAYQYYHHEMKIIENQNITEEEKSKAKKGLINFIMNQFTTEKEKKFFEGLIGGRGGIFMMID
jgi:hypothetical protein